MAKGKVTGLERVVNNLNKHAKKIEKDTLDGLFIAGLKVQRDAQKLVPVDTGNLKGSAYTTKGDTTVTIGFTANYAIFVHENMEAHHKVGQAKFLEVALRNNQDEILRILQQRAKV